MVFKMVLLIMNELGAISGQFEGKITPLNCFGPPRRLEVVGEKPTLAADAGGGDQGTIMRRTAGMVGKLAG